MFRLLYIYRYYYYYFIVFSVYNINVDTKYILCTVWIFLFTGVPRCLHVDLYFLIVNIFFPPFEMRVHRESKCILYNIYAGERMSVIFGQTSRACGIHLHPLRRFFIASIDFISRMTNQN